MPLSQFAARQKSISFPPGEREFPYSMYWKTAASMLLSGRVQAKYSGEPNLTDADRICKEANFNLQWFCHMAMFFLESDVLKHSGNGYSQGKRFDALFGDDLDTIQSAAWDGFLGLVGRYAGNKVWPPRLAQQSGLIEFLRLFWTCFQGRALPFDKIGHIFLEFSKLPEAMLLAPTITETVPVMTS